MSSVQVNAKIDAPPAAAGVRASFPAPSPGMFEAIHCYGCGSTNTNPLVMAEEDLTGKPGRFSFVTCAECGLAYQNPRLRIGHIGAYYDEEYIAHRRQRDWGWLAPLYRRALEKLDRGKLKIVARNVALGPHSSVLDVGCGAGSFLDSVRRRYGSAITGVDFKDLSDLPWLKEADFRCGLFYDQNFADRTFDLITMWHFLEHDYDPPRSLRFARELLGPNGRLIIEVPRLDSLTWRLYRERWPGLQAPQHTVLFSRASLLNMLDRCGLEIVHYLPYGAYPAYFYLFAGAAFKLLKCRGLNLSKAIQFYFLGQLLLSPILLFERHLNLAMQVAVCRRKS